MYHLTKYPTAALVVFLMVTTMGIDDLDARQPVRQFEGAVYAMSNRSDTNTVFAYGRRSDGTLELIGEFETGGPGTGPLHPPSLDVNDANDPLISADALRISTNGRYLLVTNALDHSVSSLRIRPGFSLRLVDTIDTGGRFPNSIAENDGRVFVTNIGEVFDDPDASPIDSVEASVTGFRLDQRTGSLSPLGVDEELSAPISRPSNIQFTPGGQVLVVSEINTGNFVSWVVANNGALLERKVFSGNTLAPALDGSGDSVNANPLGFRIVPGLNQSFIVATEAREAPTFATGSVSVYTLDEVNGEIAVVSQGIEAPGQETTCWLTFNDDYSLFFTANSRTNSLSAFRFDTADGFAQLLQADEIVRVDENGLPASAPIDIASSSDGRYLYQLFGRVGVVGTYAINDDGSLTLIQEIDGDLPDVGTQGIVAL